MDLPRTEGIVLRMQPVTETSLIVTWFTREAGKLKTLAKGARRPKNPMRGKIDLFYRDEIVFQRSRRSDLHLLYDCYLDEPRAKLRDSMERVAAASYVCELVDLATEVEDAHPEVFDLLDSVLDALTSRVGAVVLIWFELQLLNVTGWKPKWEKATGAPKVLSSLAGTTLVGAQRVRLTAAQVGEAREALWRFWDAELGRQPRSRRLLARAGTDSVR